MEIKFYLKIIFNIQPLSRILNSQEASKIINLENNHSIEKKLDENSDQVIPDSEKKENNLKT